MNLNQNLQIQYCGYQTLKINKTVMFLSILFIQKIKHLRPVDSQTDTQT